MNEFKECITAAALVNLPFTGCFFSWHNSSMGSRSLWKRLDRVLVNEAWLVKWPLTKVLVCTAEHIRPLTLILSGYDRNYEQGMFRFDNFLAKQPGFINTVWSTWKHSIYGTRMYGVITKMKALKPFRAQRKKKGDMTNNVHLAKSFLQQAQTLFDKYKESTLLQLVKLCQLTYCKAVQQETTYPHHGGGYCTDSPVTVDEVKEAFFDISEDSARDRMGIHQPFFKAAWPVIGGDISAAVVEFFQSGRLLKQINATLLVLIPKVQLPTRVAEFRPIACCNVVYKALTKILVRRLQKVLHLIIDYSQNAFIPGRSIADNVMLAQELLAGYNQKNSPQDDALLEFAAMSGLHVNASKSQIILSASVRAERQNILDIMGFQEGTLPITYLGVPLVASRLSIADCQPLLHKLDSRLASWGQHNLSLAGRTQLIKSVLSSLHTYWASVFILPKAVIKVIEQRIRTFLWKGSTGRGYAKVAWEHICNRRRKVGWGFAVYYR
ncbi:UNVERIFIED_CONTAM: hypothetical protein Sradi_6840000 [Sesamum radiatum]|uniref:Reverse transcriptase domain-containing protein n=1 Tax=Sesamum radiatum TaxID=300843 RepID=A0AAW2JLY4_SESRA